MKIKSISDVITNSSTEVWAIRSEILGELKSKFYEESWREKAYVSDEKENIFDLFTSLISVPQIQEIWSSGGEGKSSIYEFLPRDLTYLLSPIKTLKPSELRILKEFGITAEEIKAYIQENETKRLEYIQDHPELFKDYLGWSVAVFYDHFKMWGGSEIGKKIRSWLSENYPKDDWYYDY